MQNKWLMINIQNVQDFACQCLNRDVWSNEAVKNIIRDHFIFWQVRNYLGMDVWVTRCLGRWDSEKKKKDLFEKDGILLANLQKRLFRGVDVVYGWGCNSWICM